MFEFNDNFLMGRKSALENGEWLDCFCFASNAADDDLAQLAALVGAQSKPKAQDEDDKIALANNAPTLEFDLEEELARAFQIDEAEPDREFEMATSGTAGFSPAQEPEADPLDGVDFNDLIAEQFDKALADEVAASDGAVENRSFPADDIEQELSKLIGFAVLGGDKPSGQANGAAMDASVPPPMPTEVAEPWQNAEVVNDFPAYNLHRAETDVQRHSPQSAHSIYTPVQMSDFGPEPTAEANSDVTAPKDHSQEQIDAVLGGAMVLAAAASPSAKSATDTDFGAKVAADSESQMASELAEKDADLRLRLDELDYEHGREKRRTGRRAVFAIIAVALLGGTAALGWNYVGGPTGDIPELFASTEPVKVKPVDAGGKVVPNQDQAVYKAVEVSDQTNSKQERLTDNKEQPITIAVSPTGQKTNARVDRNQGDSTPLVLKPRSVRTVVVRPDGTIVSSAAPKVEPTIVSTSIVPTPSLSLQNQVQNQIGQMEPLQTTAIAAPNSVKVTTVPVTNLGTTKSVPAAAAAKPAAKPATKPVEVAAAKPKPAVAKPADGALPQVSSPYAVQVSSQRSAASAQKSYATLSRRHASILNGRGVDYRQVEVKGKAYFRVRIPAEDRSTANQICSRLKSAGGDCFVTR